MEVGAQADDEEAGGMVESWDGGVVVAGLTKSEGRGLNDLLLFKLNSQGQKEWIKIIGETGSEKGLVIVKLNPSGYAVCGEIRDAQSTFKDVLLMRISEDGTIEWSVRIGDSSAD